MKQIQRTISKILRTNNLHTSKSQRLKENESYLVSRRRQFIAEAPIGFKPRSNSDYFLQN